MSRLLTVADVARLRRTGRVAAYRWLKRNALKYLREGSRGIVIAASDFAVVYRSLGEERIAQRLSDLESESRETIRRVDQHAAALSRHGLL